MCRFTSLRIQTKRWGFNSYPRAHHQRRRRRQNDHSTPRRRRRKPSANRAAAGGAAGGSRWCSPFSSAGYGLPLHFAHSLARLVSSKCHSLIRSIDWSCPRVTRLFALLDFKRRLMLRCIRNIHAFYTFRRRWWRDMTHAIVKAC